MQTTQPDPLHILSSTKPVIETSRFVTINENNLGKLATSVLARFKKGLGTQEMGFTIIPDLEKNVQLVFVEDAINFCFWADKKSKKWQVKEPDGSVTNGGWFGLKTCFERGIAEGIPIWDANYLASFSMTDAKNFFRGVYSEIPLMEERVKNLQEAGKVLIKKFNGQFINAVEQADYNAIAIAELIIKNFPSFRDISMLDGNEILFYKRAQICPKDLTYIFAAQHKAIADVNQLTAFADYKLPQMLRMFGVLEYEKTLADKIDDYIQIQHDSREEIEIRAATIWAVELLHQQIPELNASDIDNAIWLLSQDLQQEAKPYHRTRTIFY